MGIDPNDKKLDPKQIDFMLLVSSITERKSKLNKKDTEAIKWAYKEIAKLHRKNKKQGGIIHECCKQLKICREQVKEFNK